ncbi:hypothetical protein Vretimale_13883 [Volvox reticuliferus]|uniref:Protein kinase domain-containing protein n=1 Tax=Volvox reticuliferus TaxID=1737510 RepID=A0A8J4FVP1_9CHLO|nr:hypothetical protein Vretifemale_14536 [Volvox reticuliferus]GIM10104.1 hypothetical protein Vretimale_13883 [Volvox reticuliferus]
MSSTKGNIGFLQKLRLLFQIKYSRDKNGDKNFANLQATQPDEDDRGSSAVVSKQGLKHFGLGKLGDNQPPISDEDTKPLSSTLSTPISLSNLIPSRRRLRAILGAASDGHLENRPIGAPVQINSSFVNSLSVDLDMSQLSSDCLGSTIPSGDSSLAVLVPLPSTKAVEVAREAGMMPPREVVQSNLSEAAYVVARSPHPTPPSPASTLLLTLSPSTPATMQRQNWSLKDYQINRRIYRGTFSSVYQATCLHSFHLVALKVYFMSRVPANAYHMLAREIAIHSELDHPNIIKLYGAFQEADRLVIVQEFAPRRDLYALIHRGYGSSSRSSRMGNEQVHDLVMAPLLDALAYLHSRGICHRDIKPENIFFDMEWKLKLGDFGVSINLREERAVTRAGTLDYMAPEVLRCPLKSRMDENKDDISLAYTTAVDVWAVGVLAYELLTGILPSKISVDPAVAASPGRSIQTSAQQQHSQPDPYSNHTHPERFQHHHPPLQPEELLLAAAHSSGCSNVNGSGNSRQQGIPLALSFPGSVPEAARDFIFKALADDPSARPTIREMSLHRWMRCGPSSSFAAHISQHQQHQQQVQAQQEQLQRDY